MRGSELCLFRIGSDKDRRAGSAPMLLLSPRPVPALERRLERLRDRCFAGKWLIWINQKILDATRKLLLPQNAFSRLTV